MHANKPLNNSEKVLPYNLKNVKRESCENVNYLNLSNLFF